MSMMPFFTFLCINFATVTFLVFFPLFPTNMQVLHSVITVSSVIGYQFVSPVLDEIFVATTLYKNCRILF